MASARLPVWLALALGLYARMRGEAAIGIRWLAAAVGFAALAAAVNRLGNRALQRTRCRACLLRVRPCNSMNLLGPFQPQSSGALAWTNAYWLTRGIIGTTAGQYDGFI